MDQSNSNRAATVHPVPLNPAIGYSSRQRPSEISCVEARRLMKGLFRRVLRQLDGDLAVNATKVVHPGLAWETVGCPPSATQAGAPNEHPQECAVDAARSTPVG